MFVKLREMKYLSQLCYLYQGCCFGPINAHHVPDLSVICIIICVSEISAVKLCDLELIHCHVE